MCPLPWIDDDLFARSACAKLLKMVVVMAKKNLGLTSLKVALNYDPYNNIERL